MAELVFDNGTLAVPKRSEPLFIDWKPGVQDDFHPGHVIA
jgi:hypothetical protein